MERNGEPMANYNRLHKNRSRREMKSLRRDIIATMFKRGATYKDMANEIAARCGCNPPSVSTIKHDVDELLEEWRAARIDDTDAALQVELQRCNDIMAEAWESWEKSKEDYERKKARQEGVPGGEAAGGGLVTLKAIQEKENVRQCGDPRFLDVINKQLQERRKLLGLYAPEKKEVSGDLSFADFLRKTGQKNQNNE